jgi:hypothetical protein
MPAIPALRRLRHKTCIKSEPDWLCNENLSQQTKKEKGKHGVKHSR